MRNLFLRLRPAKIDTLGVETFAWRNFRGKRNARNFVHFARGLKREKNTSVRYTQVNFKANVHAVPRKYRVRYKTVRYIEVFL